MKDLLDKSVFVSKKDNLVILKDSYLPNNGHINVVTNKEAKKTFTKPKSYMSALFKGARTINFCVPRSSAPYFIGNGFYFESIDLKIVANEIGKNGYISEITVMFQESEPVTFNILKEESKKEWNQLYSMALVNIAKALVCGAENTTDNNAFKSSALIDATNNLMNNMLPFLKGKYRNF